MSSTTQINILVYLCIGAHYFGDPPYLASPSRRAVSQKTSCKRNKAMDLISISAFRKDSSLKYQRPSVRTPLQRQWKGIKGDWYNKQWGSAIRKHFWASLLAQWLRICLPMQGTRVQALVWEDPTCRGATGPVSHNYWACTSGACAPQQERPR